MKSPSDTLPINQTSDKWWECGRLASGGDYSKAMSTLYDWEHRPRNQDTSIFIICMLSRVGQCKDSLPLFLHLQSEEQMLRSYWVLKKTKKIQQPNCLHTVQDPEVLVAIALIWLHRQKCQQDMASKYLPQLTSLTTVPWPRKWLQGCSLQKDRCIHLLRVAMWQGKPSIDQVSTTLKDQSLEKSTRLSRFPHPTPHPETWSQHSRPTHWWWLAGREKQKSWPEQKQSTLSRYHSIC